MPKLQVSDFCSYDLSQMEQLQGEALSEYSTYVIQNLLCQCAKEKLALTIDTTAPLANIQREAELHGQISMLQMLLETSQRAHQDLKSFANAVDSESAQSDFRPINPFTDAGMQPGPFNPSNQSGE